MISDSLWQAYLDTDYCVYSLQLRIAVGECHAELDRYLASWGANRFAYLTAWNPRSQCLSTEANQERNLALEAILAARGYRYLAGAGISRKNEWAPEESFFVIGLEENDAIELAKQFEQNAIVVGEIGQASRLVAVVPR
jgi:hypothetical protein